MTLEKIHIKDRGPLVDFKAEFGPITVIYGPNASGKSLLSNALRAIERGESLETGEATVTFREDRTLNSAHFKDGTAKNRFRVFNANFLREDVIDGDPSAIVLGSKVQEQRREIERLSTHVSNLESQKEQLTRNLQQAESALGGQHKAAGDSVRTVLRTVPMMEGANSRWSQFDRGDARRGHERMSQEDSASVHYKNSTELDDLGEAIRQRPSNLLSQLHLDDPGVLELQNRAKVLLQSIPNTSPLPEIENDPSRRDWLLVGHGYASSQGNCAYCHQIVPAERAETLDSFFSEDMTKLMGNIDELIRDINVGTKSLQAASLPDVREVRADLQSNYKSIGRRWCANVDNAASALATVKSCLESKKEKPASVIEIMSEPPAWDTDPIRDINGIIQEHNRTVDDLLRLCREYEFGVIANRFDEWKEAEDEITELRVKISKRTQEIKEAKTSLKEVQREADTKLIAADELTDMVRNFLGHDEIGFRLDADDRSYHLTRHGEPARDFSEGERTALALMYFLKRLEDDSFDKRNGTLVFDDPITSFDEDNLYRAIADIVTRTGMKDEQRGLQARKIVVMTHHFGLFERLWMELRNKRNDGKAQFYDLRCQFVDSRRASKLVPLKNMLATDYMLAFYEVQSMANGCETVNNPETSLRKCVEGFITRMAPGAIDQGLSSAYWSFVNRHKQVTVRKEDLQLIISIANGGSHLSAVSQRACSDRHWSTLQATSTNFLKLMSDAAPQHYGDLKTWYSRRVKQEALLKVESGT